MVVALETIPANAFSVGRNRFSKLFGVVVVVAIFVIGSVIANRDTTTKQININVNRRNQGKLVTSLALVVVADDDGNNDDDDATIVAVCYFIMLFRVVFGTPEYWTCSSVLYIPGS